MFFFNILIFLFVMKSKNPISFKSHILIKSPNSYTSVHIINRFHIKKKKDPDRESKSKIKSMYNWLIVTKNYIVFCPKTKIYIRELLDWQTTSVNWGPWSWEGPAHYNWGWMFSILVLFIYIYINRINSEARKSCPKVYITADTKKSYHLTQNTHKMEKFLDPPWRKKIHCSENRTGPAGPTGWTGNRPGIRSGYA